MLWVRCEKGQLLAVRSRGAKGCDGLFTYGWCGLETRIGSSSLRLTWQYSFLLFHLFPFLPFSYPGVWIQNKWLNGDSTRLRLRRPRVSRFPKQIIMDFSNINIEKKDALVPTILHKIDSTPPWWNNHQVYKQWRGLRIETKNNKNYAWRLHTEPRCYLYFTITMCFCRGHLHILQVEIAQWNNYLTPPLLYPPLS